MIARTRLTRRPHAPHPRSADGSRLSLTLIGTWPLAGVPGQPEPPEPDPRLLAMWATMGEPRDPEAEIAWRVEHWRLLNGGVLPFDPAEHRALEERAVAHAGSHESPAAHAIADQGGFDRGAELAAVRTPTLVIEAPQDPAAPPPSARLIAAAIPGARLVTIPGMGHALGTPVLAPLAEAILAHTARPSLGRSG